MNTSTRQRILDIIHTQGKARPNDLAHSLNLSRAAIHRQLNQLLADQSIDKIGMAPRVFYVAKLPTVNLLKKNTTQNLMTEIHTLTKSLNISSQDKHEWLLEGRKYEN